MLSSCLICAAVSHPFLALLPGNSVDASRPYFVPSDSDLVNDLSKTGLLADVSVTNPIEEATDVGESNVRVIIAGASLRRAHADDTA